MAYATTKRSEECFVEIIITPKCRQEFKIPKEIRGAEYGAPALQVLSEIKVTHQP